jgi:hypothetical protein
MATTTLKEVIDRCKVTLQEITTDGTRWANQELVDWAGEFYQLASSVNPAEFSGVREFTCVSGTKQDAPNNVVQIIDITRNLDGTKMPIFATTKNVLDSTRRGWHGELESQAQEVFVLDERYPRTFYVWPPAQAGSKVEVVAIAVPEKHLIADYSGGTASIKCSDRLTPSMVDYILFRAYSKDAEFAGNQQRSDIHYRNCLQTLQAGRDVRYQVSPTQGQ